MSAPRAAARRVVMSLDTLQQQVGEWGNETFPNATNSSIMRHLNEEASELWLTGPTEELAEEAADCLLLLLHLAHRNGFSLFDAATAKHTVNTTRIWETDAGGKGYWKHQETTTA